MKVAIIGVGTVGSAVATAVHTTGLFREMGLFDRDGIRSRVAAEDLGHASTFNFDIKITAVSNYRDIRGSDVVIIAAGKNQKPGETRMDIVQANADVIRDIVPQVMANVHNKNVVLIVVTDPLDVMVMLATDLAGLPTAQVVGTGTMLDSARFKMELRRQLGVSAHSIQACVVGEHGDSSVLNWSAVTIGGIPLDDFVKQTNNSLPATKRKTIEYRVHNAAYEIIQGRGATWDGIGAVVADLLRCIVNDEKRILPVSRVEGHGETAVAVSVPRVIGAAGVIDTLIPKMNKDETKALQRSAAIIRQGYDSIK